MSLTHNVTAWIEQFKAGEADAANLLWQRYFERLVNLAHQHLAVRVRRAADGEDVALVAFAGFCAGVAAGRFPRLDNRHDLWRILLSLTSRQARKLANRETALRRDAGRTVPAADLSLLSDDSPDPTLAAEVADELACLLARLPDDELREVATELLAGKEPAEIADRLGCSVRTVYRQRHIIRRYWRTLEQS
jgi:DNA-directed RNA polymerase specialized sigma24 family protein